MQPTITITLNPQEAIAFRKLLDAALRHAGVDAAVAVVHFLGKLDAKPGADVTELQTKMAS